METASMKVALFLRILYTEALFLKVLFELWVSFKNKNNSNENDKNDYYEIRSSTRYFPTLRFYTCRWVSLGKYIWVLNILS